MIHVGLTDTLNDDTFEQYVHWIQSLDGKSTIQKLSREPVKEPVLETLDGLLLTGGGDVHPRYYGMENQYSMAKAVNDERDEFEFKLIEQALDREMPILGVCRGMQVMNVYLGGSLVVDLNARGFDRHAGEQDQAMMHQVSVDPHSLLHTLTGTEEITVNSIHHQGVDRLGNGLISTAVSKDGVPEAAEWAIKDHMPFLMLVQWHPERIRENGVSQKLASVFLRECYQYQSNKRTVQTDH